MKAVNVDEVLKILYKYGEFIFATDNKKYSDMVYEIANLKALEQESCEDAIHRDRTIQDFVDKCRECEREKLHKQVLEDIKAEVEQYSLLTRERVIGIIDKHISEKE